MFVIAAMFEENMADDMANEILKQQNKRQNNGRLFNKYI